MVCGRRPELVNFPPELGGGGGGGGALGFGLFLPLRTGLTDHGFASSGETGASALHSVGQEARVHAFLSAMHV